MTIPVKILNGVTLTAVMSLSLAPATLAGPLLDQIVNTEPLYEIADDTVAELLDDNDCAILTEPGFIVAPDDADVDVDGDGRPERFCTPGFVHRIFINEHLALADLLTKTDLDRDGTRVSNETHVLEIESIISNRQITPGNYYIVISGTGTVNEANVIDLVQISEDEALALLTEIERERAVEIIPLQLPESTPRPLPQLPPPPAPAPRVQPPAPAPAVPALW